MPKGYSLHIGVNKVDLKHYKKLQELRAAVNDAEYMAQLAERRFAYTPGKVKKLLNEKATTKNVINVLREYQKELVSGDILLLTYSGHGGQVQDPHWQMKGEDEPVDSTWCLYDRQLIDDELFELFKGFKAGVRILVVSDSCHSGSVTKVFDESDEARIENEIAVLMAKYDMRPKMLSPDQASVVQAANHKAYLEVQEGLKKASKQNTGEIGASVMLYAACQDNQVAYDGPIHGRFTATLKQLVEQDFLGASTAEGLFNHLKNAFVYPVPNLFLYGAHIPAFEQNIPFLVDVAGASIVVGTRLPTQAPSIAAPAAQKPMVEKMPLRVSVTTDDDAPLTDEIAVQLIPPGTKRYNRNGNKLTLEFDSALYHNVWDAVYAVSNRADRLKLDVLIEPADSRSTPIVSESEVTRNASESHDYMPQWPPMTTVGAKSIRVDWYFDQEHSQLAAARDALMAEMANGQIPNKTVRIGHLDTGYWPAHPAVMSNKNIRRDLAKSFVSGEQNNPGLDIFYGQREQQDHGLGTLCILAGGKVNSEATYGFDMGFAGAAPFAEIIPIRIADSVIILDTDTFCDGLDYAVEMGCEVVSMSMGGKPSRKMAKAINRAYEAGVVIVTAAGNSIVKGLAAIGPRTVVWPARFERVLAACGACHNHIPYDFDAQKEFTKGSIDDMQGNWGPASAMQFALAAYTPNVLWASRNAERPFKKSGGGTSSATPQIAAAAAMYITKHRAALEAKGYYNSGQKWKKVEAVRRALFSQADKTKFEHWQKYYGNGLLRAFDALGQPVMDISDNMKAKEASSSWFGLSEAVGSILNRRRAQPLEPIGENQRQALALELAHVLMSDERLAEVYNNLETEYKWDDETAYRVADAVRNSPYCSEGLKSIL